MSKSRCDTGDSPGSEDIKYVTEKQTSAEDFTVGAVYGFTSDTKEVCRVYRFRAIIEPEL